MQGLSSGNYSFQVAAVDVAGNAGQPTENYLFVVDGGLQADGTSKQSFWGLGWKFWLIVGAGGFVVVAIPLTAAALFWCCSRKRTRGVGYVPHPQVPRKSSRSDVLWN